MNERMHKNPIHEINGIKFNLTKKFQFVDDKETQFDEFAFPVFPNENLKSSDHQRKIVYAQAMDSLAQDHIVSQIDNLVDLKECDNNSCTFVHFFDHRVLILNRRLNEIVFCNIYKFDSIEELLYYIAAVFHALNLDPLVDKLICQGSIVSDSAIVSKLKIYFRNLIVK